MLTTPYLQIAAAVAGLVGGSVIVFLGPRLAAYRFPDGIELPPATTLIPLAGGFLADWRPVRTALLELATAAAFVALTLRYKTDAKLYLGAAYSLLLIAIGAVDLDYRLVLNRLSYPGILVALGGAILWPGLGIKSGLIGAVVGLVVFGVLESLGRGALGTGDTKLAVLIGAMRGFPGVLNALLIGVILGGLAAAFLLFVLRRGRKEYIAYAPYLAIGAIVSFFVTSP